MGTKENNDVNPLGTTEAVAAYEEAMKEFATNATQFMEHIAFLAKARDAYQRAMAVSARLRTTLDSGDEVLQTLMTKIEKAVDLHPGKDASDKKREASKADNGKANGERADAARA